MSNPKENMQSTFEYTQLDLAGAEREDHAMDVMLDIHRFLNKYGHDLGEVIIKMDPDATFAVSLLKGHSIQGMIMEGEDRGQMVFLYRLDQEKLIKYEPGPWETRLRMLVE